jgi:hypothetical protein
MSKLDREIERWRRLFVMGEIDEPRYRREVLPAKSRRDVLEESNQPLDVERAVAEFADIGKLWHLSDVELQRTFIAEVFDRVTVKGSQVVEIAPKALYRPLFAIDRVERFGGVMESVNWLPGQVSEQHLLAIVTVGSMAPALVV